MARVEPLTTVQLIGERLAAADDVDQVVEAVVAGVTEYLGVSAVTLGLVDETASHLVPVAVVGLAASSAPLVDTPTDLRPGVPAHDVLESRTPLFWSSPAERDRMYPKLRAYPTQQAAWAVLPLLSRGSGIGVMSLGWAEPRDLSGAEQALLSV